ncbi:MAG TPA: helix-turn-helix transcriptional regulator [Thermoanaerobaculia bacterium]|nr:helix-turn-helix transcriptional regulator [Thermoanaerobaculia bacterium]
MTKRASKSSSDGQRSNASHQSQVRALRIERGLTQNELADKCEIHRNSLGKIERGITKEVTRETAVALSETLQVPITRLGLRVLADVEARSVRFRRLSPEQRFIVDEILTLPPEAYSRLLEVIDTLRRKPKKSRSRGSRD